MMNVRPNYGFVCAGGAPRAKEWRRASVTRFTLRASCMPPMLLVVFRQRSWVNFSIDPDLVYGLIMYSWDDVFWRRRLTVN